MLERNGLSHHALHRSMLRLKKRDIVCSLLPSHDKCRPSMSVGELGDRQTRSLVVFTPTGHCVCNRTHTSENTETSCCLRNQEASTELQLCDCWILTTKEMCMLKKRQGARTSTSNQRPFAAAVAEQELCKVALETKRTPTRRSS